MGKLGRAAVFSIGTFAAMALALFIAFGIGLERPFWAMSTVYIVSQPMSGAVRSKAAFRVVGTMIGAVAAVVLVPGLVNSPLILSLALSGWVAICLYVSVLDRTPRAYLFMLAGYTAAIIGFSSVGNPETIFATAVQRAQEIGLGVVCAAFVHSAFFPLSVSAAIDARVQEILIDLRASMNAALSGEMDAVRTQHRLASDIGTLHAMATHVAFDPTGARPSRMLLAALQDRLLLMLPLLSAVEDRRLALLQLGAVPDDVERLMADVRQWVHDDGDPSPLLRTCDALSQTTPHRGWPDLLALNLLARLRELIAGWNNTRLLANRLAASETSGGDVTALLAKASGRSLHNDHGLALLSGAAALIAIFGCCLFWIVTAWPDGANAAAMTAIICCFFATLDDPVPGQRSFLVWTAVSAPLSALYLFALLPHVHDFTTLMLVLAPAMLVIGMLMTIPRWHARMMPLVLGLAGGLALDNRFTPDPVQFLNGVIAQMAAALAAILVTRLIRSIGNATAIGRIRVAGWRDLARLTARFDASFAGGWNSRMLDRAALIAGRLGDRASEEEAIAVLAELRLGVNIINLHALERGAGFDDAPLRADIATHFGGLARGRSGDGVDKLLPRIDEAIAAAVEVQEPARRRDLLVTLTGLRRNFFPAAPGWTKEPQAA